MKDAILLLPEIFLVVTLAGVIGGEIGNKGEKVRFTTATALAGLGGAFIQTLLTYRFGAAPVLGGALYIDGLALFFKLISIILAMVAIGTSVNTNEISGERRAEFCALVVGSALAMCLATSGADLLLVFLSLQLLNVLGYFLSAHARRSIASSEASIKHLAFGSLAGVVMLYGIAVLFAHTHELNIYEMHKLLVATPLSREAASVVFTLMFLSLSFQLGVFPMHLWVPDVLQGAPTPASAFLSLAPRIAGFAVAIRFLIVVFAQPALEPGIWQELGGLEWTRILSIVAGLSMLIGSLLALKQSSAKRMVAYLAVAESGFLLLGLLVLDQVGVAALLFSLVVQLLSLTGAYLVISFLVDELGKDSMSDLKGMMQRAVPECVSLVIFLACLVGLPPLPGFISKFALIGAVVRHQQYSLAAIAVMAIAVSVAAIARLSFSLLGEFSRSTSQAVAHNAPRRVSLALLLVPMVLLSVFAESLLRLAGQSLHFLLW